MKIMFECPMRIVILLGCTQEIKMPQDLDHLGLLLSSSRDRSKHAKQHDSVATNGSSALRDDTWLFGSSDE